MNRSSKVLAALLVASFASTSLTGCTGYKPDPSESTTTTTSAEVTTETTEETTSTETTVDDSGKSYMEVVDLLCEKCGFTVVEENENLEIAKRIVIDNDDPTVVSVAAAGYNCYTEAGGIGELRIRIYDEEGTPGFESDRDQVLKFTDRYLGYEQGDNYVIWSVLEPGSGFDDGRDQWFTYGYYNCGGCYIKVICQTHTDFDATPEWYKEIDGIFSELGLPNPMKLHTEYKAFL
ncbi:MAG: hypothetical protein MJ084_04730 [Saccharofermentans sp.]|nr:hypothetical protein [Saccharofermentans sp.]